MGMFNGFKATEGNPGNGKDLKFIKDGFPVIQSVCGGVTEFYIKISDRFWVEMALENADKGDQDQWFSIVKLTAPLLLPRRKLPQLHCRHIASLLSWRMS